MVIELAATTAGMISSTVQVLSTLRDVAKDTDIKTALNGAVNDLIAANTIALEAQRLQALDGKRIRELEDANLNLKQWAHQKTRYELHELVSGKLAYKIKAVDQGTEPTHCICANCYEDGQKSILQIVPRERRTTAAFCPRCKTELDLSYGVDVPY